VDRAAAVEKVAKVRVEHPVRLPAMRLRQP